jgi:Alginate export
MNKKLQIIHALSLALMVTPVLAAESLANKDSEGKLLFDTRLRMESVDDEAFIENALATTLRLRLGYRTPLHNGWSGVIELEHTSHLFDEDFNSTANQQLSYPAVVDPDNTELNQAYVQYLPTEKTKWMLGRQRVIYDNQRFFGNVGWRQNEQTFDAFNLEHRFNQGFNFRYSYLDRVNRIYGDDHPNKNLARWQLDAHLLSLNHTLGPGVLTGYAHFIDNQTLPLSSHQNIGLRYAAKSGNKDDIGWLATGEYAKQKDYADGSNSIDADYLLLEGGIVWKANTFKLGYEQLSGNGSYGFATPFATLHAFNGWADRFLTTPVNGLQDSYLAWNRKFGKLTANVVWHDYQSDRLSVHYGQEWNASLNWAFKPHWNAMLKLADYHADDTGFDVRKTWLSVEYAY